MHGQRVHHHRRRLRGQCRGRGRAARRARALTPARSAAPTTRSATASWPSWRARASTAAAWCASPARPRRCRSSCSTRTGERMIATYRDGSIGTALPADPDAAGRGCRRRAGRQPLSRIRAADLRGGAAARHSDRARRRPADHRGRSAVRARDPRDLFGRMPARDHRPRRSRRRLAAHGAEHATASSPSATARTASIGSTTARCAHMPVFKVEAIDTLGAGDVFHGGFALALAEGRDAVATPCALPAPPPRSNARASAAAWARPRAPRSRRFWQAAADAIISASTGTARRRARRRRRNPPATPPGRSTGESGGRPTIAAKPMHERRWHRRCASRVTRATGRTAAAA